MKEEFICLKQHVKDLCEEVGFCKVGMNDILKRLSTLERENKDLKDQIKKHWKNEKECKDEEKVNDEGKNEDETAKEATVDEATNSGQDEEYDDDDVPLINRLKIVKYSESAKEVAHVKFLKTTEQKNKTPSSMVRKIKMKSRKKTSKALPITIARQINKVCYRQYCKK